MFYDIAAKLFKWQHIYLFTHTSGQFRVYDIVFAKDYSYMTWEAKKTKSTRSWKKAMKWLDAGHKVVPVGFVPNTDQQEATCGAVVDYDVNQRNIALNFGDLVYIGRCRKTRRWR